MSDTTTSLSCADNRPGASTEGRTYYHNPRTGETTWNKPAVAAALFPFLPSESGPEASQADSRTVLKQRLQDRASSGAVSHPADSTSLLCQYEVRGNVQVQSLAAAAAANPSQDQASESANPSQDQASESTETWASSTAVKLEQPPLSSKPRMMPSERFIIYYDQDGNELQRKMKHAGRNPRGAVLEGNNWIVRDCVVHKKTKEVMTPHRPPSSLQAAAAQLTRPFDQTTLESRSVPAHEPPENVLGRIKIVTSGVAAPKVQETLVASAESLRLPGADLRGEGGGGAAIGTSGAESNVAAKDEEREIPTDTMLNTNRLIARVDAIYSQINQIESASAGSGSRLTDLKPLPRVTSEDCGAYSSDLLITTNEISEDVQSDGALRKVASAAEGASAQALQGQMPESRRERDEEGKGLKDVVEDVLWVSSAAATMQGEAPRKKRGRPPKATAEGDEKKLGGKWVVWYDEDGNEVDRRVKVGCCVAVARLSALVQRSDFTTRLAIQLRRIACTRCRFHASLMLCCACSPC